MAGLSLAAQLLVFYGTRVPDHPRKWWFHDQLLRLSGVRVEAPQEVVRGGLKWLLNPSDFTDASLFWMGARDDWDIFHLQRLTAPGAVMLDAGANFGYYSLVLAAALGRNCHIFALEPNPANFKRLCRHIDWNGMGEVIEPHLLGVSDRPETVQMRQPSENSGHTAVDPAGGIRDVSLITLDDFCRMHDVKRLDLLILDVEGYEERALKGAAEILKRFKPIVFVELFPPVMACQSSSPKGVVDILTANGYHLFVARKGELVPLTEIPEGDCRENVFCFHSETHTP